MPPSENSLNEAMNDDRRQPAKPYWYIRRVSNKSKIFALEDTDWLKIKPFREFSAYTVFTAGCRNRIIYLHLSTIITKFGMTEWTSGILYPAKFHPNQ